MGRFPKHCAFWFVCVVVTAGCDPLVFDDLEDEAPVVVLEAPDNYPQGGFSAVLAAYSGALSEGPPVSRIAVTGGPGTPYFVYPAWTGDAMELGTSLFNGCDDEDDCELDAGTTIAGFPVWRAGAPNEGRLCVLVTAPATGTMSVRCETSAQTSEAIDGLPDVRFGASSATLDEGNPLGVAVLGAPESGTTGGIFRLTGSAEVLPIDLAAAGLSGDARLGEQIATARLPASAGGGTLIAAAAPGASRAVVAVVDDAGVASVRWCLAAPDEWNGAIAVGDLDGDALPEIALGRSEDGEVHVFSGADLPGTEGCNESVGTPAVVSCTALRDVACAGSRFGTAIAFGDVNGDALSELLVGAPAASVEGKESAGAVFVFEGQADGIEDSAADVLIHSSPEERAEVGASIAVVASQLGDERQPRIEPVVGSPGNDEVLVFLCTSLEGDTQANGPRCVAP